ncbi:aldehyde dehydrogenase [Saccharopolyspora mangrovi]|uniref:Aldehyde dehydrogenase n=1 Tax=Saccharopolyspora mangrovi TaxID=3082379 RepID=A0ABU6ALC1_9PSEU|nr:aldehyde dehydrogenase [Saccharopolyspora sp. S2-29]MEB3372349.1 aldehyde dehydrogenase [Saccharopolyspora sp. S2-29]
MIDTLSTEHLYIGGRWVAPDRTDRLGVISPATEEVVASVPAAAPSDVDAAVAAARAALDGGWARTSVADRIALVRALREEIDAHRPAFAELITTEMGCPITQARAIQAVSPVQIMDEYLDVAQRYPFREVRTSLDGASALVTREPVGVVAAVIPWNVPLGIAVQKLTPALLAGCAVVLKTAPEAPLDAYLLAELVEKAGLPPGTFNMLCADRETSEYLVRHPGVDKVTFTGSSAAGRRIAALCGNDLRRVTLELGGKSAAIVLDDADAAATAESLRMGSFRNSGQICTLKTRVLVPAQRRDEFADALADMVRSRPQGDPHDERTQIGPLVSARQRATVERYLDGARTDGAKALTGGGRPDRLPHGWYVEPTVLVDVEPDMRVAQEEIFGPVVGLIAYSDETEAVRIANATPYGLNGAVFTSDLERGMRVASRMHTGTVELNGSPAGLAAPMGGVKGSGIGRENGPEGIDTYVEPKAIGLPPDAPVPSTAGTVNR